MTVWIIEPREPVIVRDGRPFNHQPGIMAATLPFPFPTTTAGAARSRAGSEDGVFRVEPDDLPALKGMQVRGPLLAEFDSEVEMWNLLVPAPSDALLLEGADEKSLRCKQLLPLHTFAGSQYSPFHHDTTLAPVGPEIYEPEKPAKNLPAFWHWQKFVEWLLHPAQVCSGSTSKKDLGIQSLPQEERVHVALERGMMVAREGALFATRGLEFTSCSGDAPKLAGARRLALWLDVPDGDGSISDKIQLGLDSLGGERRLVSWQKNNVSMPTCPKELCEDIVLKGACRLILLTPAFFQKGYLPDVSLWESESVKLELCATLVGRPQVVSGWDINTHHPKPTRRLAPAGSVFFLRFRDKPDATAIRAWVERTWMMCFSEGENQQNKNDGFGLAVLGYWDGNLKQMHLLKEEAQ